MKKIELTELKRAPEYMGRVSASDQKETTLLNPLLNSPYHFDYPRPTTMRRENTEENSSLLCLERLPRIDHQVYDFEDLIPGKKYYFAQRGGTNHDEIVIIKSDVPLTLYNFPGYDKFSVLCGVFGCDPKKPYALIPIAFFGMAPYPDGHWEENRILIDADIAERFYPHLTH